MSRQKISQREALRLRKRVAELEEAERVRVAYYRQEYPGGVHLVTVDLSTLHEDRGRLQAGAKLGAALVAQNDGARLNVFAVLPSKELA